MKDLREVPSAVRRIYEGRTINLRVETVVLPDDNSASREIVEHRGAVAIVPMLPDNRVVMVRQYRRAADTVLLEIPAGTRDPNEEIESCARRELIEEIQYSAGHMEKMFEAYMAPGYSTEKIHFYLATQLVPTHGVGDDDEFIEIELLPLETVLGLIDAGEIQDAKTISAIFFVARRIG